MAGKQFSPFMEMVVQPMSYNLCNCVLRFMEMVVQPFLTACATASYGLWKWLASSSPIYGNGFRSGTSENQRLHRKLGNSEIRLHTDLGNFRTEKALLKQGLVELRSKLKTERADRKEIEAELCELK
jgi:hypothetical protein